MRLHSRPSTGNTSGSMPNLSLPKYKCHKIVGAAPIASILGNEIRLVDFATPLVVAEKVAARLLEASNGQPELGYLVEYTNDYLSFSPKAVFEEGYAPLDEEETPDGHDERRDDLTRDLIVEVRYLRRQNELLGARVEALDLLRAIVRPEQRGGGMTIDTAAMLEKILDGSQR